VLPLFESGIPLLIKRLASLEGDSKNVTVAYPDEGAWKRFHYQFSGIPEVICTKVRDGAKRIVRLKEGDPKGRHVVIVDDLVQSGGTLIECGKLLHSLGAAHVSAYVTHGVFPKSSYERFAPETQDGSFGWKHVWITDSCPQTSAAVEGRAPFEIMSLAEPIANALRV
jgi:phosphoribosylpyrophosphate synthetase